jgi:hypothetical protein
MYTKWVTPFRTIDSHPKETVTGNMASMQIHLFATRKDIEQGIRLFERENSLKYTLCGLFPSSDVHVYSSLFQIENLGKTTAPNQSLCDEFLVMKCGVELEIRDVQQKSGGVKYAVDQQSNPASVCFRPGGIYHDEFLIAGRIGTASSHPDAAHLFREFGRAATQGFRKQREYFVGPDAFRLYQDGVRLITMHVGEDRKYDLNFS